LKLVDEGVGVALGKRIDPGPEPGPPVYDEIDMLERDPPSESTEFCD
jgi:hypothetical protein